MDPETEADLVKAIQIAVLETRLGVHPIKSAHGLSVFLRELSQRGSLSLDELTENRAMLGRWTDEHANGWAKGYAEGCATAILRVLEQRGVSVPDEIDGFLTTRTDVKALTDWLDLALTVTDAKDLFTSWPVCSQAPED
ncbi:hypothetical protein [Streptomyces sp. DH10]|uniref:hypothetical protein n=1 Tax=Streptomyces sp. DH10 TaxID=3040121 RepID=UPI002442A42C|nr:hypothetical protein [Streptomyces sp. DH10]MDG9714554.1 hypothetical protein [Streptomyces sp. DH10]